MHPRLKLAHALHANKGHGYHYDVKSMYPTAMKNDMPVGMPRFRTKGQMNMKWPDFFGFVSCLVKAPSDLYCPLLGVMALKRHRRNGRYVHPLGIFKGFWFSEELRVAVENGYTVEEFYFGVEFERGRVFDRYPLKETRSTRLSRLRTTRRRPVRSGAQQGEIWLS
jgi:hypothetical protein